MCPVADLPFEKHLTANNYFNDNGEFEPALFSMDLQKILHIVTIKDNRDIYIYNDKEGYYESNGEETLRALTKKVLRLKYRELHAKATIDDITASTHIEREDFHHPPHLIPVENGLINLQTPEPHQLLPHDSKYYVTGVLPVEYNPNAKCPKFDKFLEQILPQTSDRIKIQEGFGNCLTTSTDYMIIYMLVGEGSNGKSTLLNVLFALLGKVNVSSVSLFDLAYGQWYTADLFGKLANIYADIESHELKSTGNIKILTGDDTAKGERKYQRHFNFKNNAKPWFSANKIPYSHDDSNAFYRRFRIIRFTQEFREGEADPQMIRKITTKAELSGILNWALEGLHRLVKQKTFSFLESVEERRRMWQIESNSLQAFINDCIDCVIGRYITKEKLYQAYTEYCVKRNLQIMTKDKVGKILQTLLPNVGEIYKLVGNKQEKSWSGICLKEEVSEQKVLDTVGENAEITL